MLQLIVGLANPGSEYADTRHNAGAWFLERLLPNSSDWVFEKAFHGLCGQLKTPQGTVKLLIPTTFMNHSGRAIRAIAQFYKIPTSSILVAHDELDLPAGVVRLKQGGGSAGHNGLKDTIAQLGSPDFLRLRIGIDRPKPGQSVVDYVLHKPSRSDYEAIQSELFYAERIIPELIQGHFAKAMQELHTKKAEL